MGITKKAEKLCGFIFILIHFACLVAAEEKKVSSQDVFLPKRLSDLDADFILGGLFPVHVSEKNVSKCMEERDPRYTFMSSVFGGKDCYKINLSGLMWVEAMLFAINEINKSPNILPNKKLGYVITDSGNNANIALNATLDYIYNTGQTVNNSRNKTCSCSKTGRTITALIGGAGSKISRTVSYILGIDNIPQISYSSTSPSLSDKLYFPSFLRTIPSDLMQAEVMADLVAFYNWTYVSTIATDEDYGRFGIQSFKKAIKSRNICISVDELFHSNLRLPETRTKISEIVQKLKEDERAKVVVLFSEAPSALAVIEEAQRIGLKGKIWIGTEAWGDKSDVLPFSNEIVGGMLGVLPWRGKIENFERYMARLTPLNSSHNPWFTEYWKGHFGCQLEERNKTKTFTARNETSTKTKNGTTTKLRCGSKSVEQENGNAALVETKKHEHEGEKTITCSKCIYGSIPTAAQLQLNKAPNVMDAVYAVALALHNMVNCKETNGLLSHGKCPTVLNGSEVIPNELLIYLKNLTFIKNLGYPVKFDRHGDTKGTVNKTRLNCSLLFIIRNIRFGTAGKIKKSLLECENLCI